MLRSRANLLRHDGHGPRHFDLVIADGARCPTLRLQQHHQHWSAHWSAPHRRRYLTYQGHLSGGRGRVVSVWQGAVRRRRLSGGWWVRLDNMVTIVMRGTYAHISPGWSLRG